jgi:hypothetical protein
MPVFGPVDQGQLEVAGRPRRVIETNRAVNLDNLAYGGTAGVRTPCREQRHGH